MEEQKCKLLSMKQRRTPTPFSSSQVYWNNCVSSAVYYSLAASSRAVVSMLLRTVSLQWALSTPTSLGRQCRESMLRSCWKPEDYIYGQEIWVPIGTVGQADPQALKSCCTYQRFPKSSAWLTLWKIMWQSYAWATNVAEKYVHLFRITELM